MTERNILVAYYSHSGHTQKAGDRLAAETGAAVERIQPEQEFRWPLGLWRAGRMSYRGETQPLEPDATDPARFDLVVVGTPLWALHVSPPVRSWLERHKERLPETAFLVTYGGVGQPKALDDMAEVIGRDPVANLVISHQDEGRDRDEAKIREFAQHLKTMPLAA